MPLNRSQDSDNDSDGHGYGASTSNILGGQNFADVDDDEEERRRGQYTASQIGQSCPSEKKGASIDLNQLNVKVSGKGNKESTDRRQHTGKNSVKNMSIMKKERENKPIFVTTPLWMNMASPLQHFESEHSNQLGLLVRLN